MTMTLPKAQSFQWKCPEEPRPKKVQVQSKQKQRRMEIAQEMSTTFNDEPDWLKKILTGDESWVHDYDIA